MGQASVYFYDSNNAARQTLHRRIIPSDTQFEEQQARWNALADFLIEQLNKSTGRTIRSWLQGSYKFATQIRPVHKGEEFDIDLGLYVCWTGTPEAGGITPRQLKRMVQDGLNEFRGQNEDAIEVVKPPKKRCGRIRFTGDFHIDVPSYHLDEKDDIRSLATEEDRWEDSDPKAIYLWFKNQFDEYQRDRVRRLVRYIKVWAALKFSGGNGRPSSLLLTVLMADAVRELEDGLPGPEDEAVAVVIRRILDRVVNERTVRNPMKEDEDLARELDKGEWETFVSRLRAFAESAEQAVGDDNVVSACSHWSAEFEHLFPLPEEGDQRNRAERLPAVVTLPEVRVTAISRDNPNLRYTGNNAIGPIPKNCTIVFEVTNPYAMPAGTGFQWMVRNAGDEAEGTNDLGHKAGMGLRAEERSAYAGKHFMDCSAIVNGRLIGLRRVSVTISGMPAPRRNPPRPAYVRLRGKR